jgi:hypothetical protein
MTTKHNISRASQVFAGAYHPGAFNMNGRAGAPIGNLVQVSLGTPTVGAADTLRTAAAHASAGDLTLDATTLDVARAISITSTGVDTAVVFTVTGYDIGGQLVVETITGVNATTIAGKKAFKSILSISSDVAAAGNISVGDTDALGLPYAALAAGDVLFQYAGATEELSSSTLVLADATKPATATTGDVRGTINPNTTLDGSTEIKLWMKADGSSPDALGGVAQYAG